MKKNKGHARCNAFGIKYLAKNDSFDYLIVMDADGEDRPEEIRFLVNKALEVQKESARIQSELGKYGAEVSKEGARFQSDLAKAKASLDEAAIRLQSSGAYTQKSQASIQTSQLYYQRALSELQGITGAMTAPEQQQQSQRREQGAST